MNYNIASFEQYNIVPFSALSRRTPTRGLAREHDGEDVAVAGAGDHDAGNQQLSLWQSTASLAEQERFYFLPQTPPVGLQTHR